MRDEGKRHDSIVSHRFAFRRGPAKSDFLLSRRTYDQYQEEGPARAIETYTARGGPAKSGFFS